MFFFLNGEKYFGSCVPPWHSAASSVSLGPSFMGFSRSFPVPWDIIACKSHPRAGGELVSVVLSRTVPGYRSRKGTAVKQLNS